MKNNKLNLCRSCDGVQVLVGQELAVASGGGGGGVAAWKKMNFFLFSYFTFVFIL